VIDDRILCTDCRELAPNGNCRAAMRRERRDVRRDYGQAELDLPHRCEFFRAKPDAEDQRSGRERYPTMYADYLKRFPEAA